MSFKSHLAAVRAGKLFILRVDSGAMPRPVGFSVGREKLGKN
jgi:hypothetical protein